MMRFPKNPDPAQDGERYQAITQGVPIGTCNGYRPEALRVRNDGSAYGVRTGSWQIDAIFDLGNRLFAGASLR